VAEAGKKQDKIYVVYNHQVLDITDFDHPGPKENITDNIGKDISELFEDAEHSNYAKELCQKYVIGQLTDNTGKLLKNDFIDMSKEEEELHR
jgi:cytochrome b involved in lipid metabolism